VRKEKRPVEDFEPVVPQDVEYPGLGDSRVTDQPEVVAQDATQLAQYRRLRAHVSAQVQYAHERACPQLRRFEKVAADEVESDSRVGQTVRQPEGVWAVAAARQQCCLRPHLLVG